MTAPDGESCENQSSMTNLASYIGILSSVNKKLFIALAHRMPVKSWPSSYFSLIFFSADRDADIHRGSETVRLMQLS
ncbi:hypothetical protein LJC47_05230 [Desulfosarcina sp. OttesenSCG-928-B08]|nr:hypothetical protein [Desulfosarcina sp. OttesenSCG-928-B08]